MKKSIFFTILFCNLCIASPKESLMLELSNWIANENSTKPEYVEIIDLDGNSYTNSKFKRNKLEFEEDFDFYCHTTNKKLRPIATKETSRLAPKSYYAETKLRQEHIVKKINKELGINCIILRLQNVYGEGQSLINPYTGVLSIFSNRILTSSNI